MTDAAQAPEPDPTDETAAETDRPPVELVQPAETPAPSTDLVRKNEALEAAADAALVMPGVPGRDEFLSLAMQARILSLSGAAPKAVRNNPYVAFHVAMVGRDLGISPSAALNLIDVIGEGEDAQLSLSPQLLNGQIRRLGLGSIIPGAADRTMAWAIALGPAHHVDHRCQRMLPDHVDDCRCHGILGATQFTWEDAKDAGLVKPECEPGAHTDLCRRGGNGSSGKRCRQGWRTYPKRMLWWRAAGYCADDWFPEAGLGLYTAEELGAVVDEEGRPIDPGSVDLPDGYQPAERETPVGERLLAEDDPERHAEFTRRLEAIKAVPPAREALVAMWTAQDDNGVPALPQLARMQRRHAAKANAMLRSVEDRVRKGEWGDDGLAAWTAATERLAPRTDAEDPQDGDGGTARPEVPQAPEDGGGADRTPGADETPTVDEGAGCDACGRTDGTHDQALHEMADATDKAKRRQRAEQIAAEAGLQIGSDGIAVPVAPEPEPALTGKDLAEAIATEVKAMALGDVVSALQDAGLDWESGNPQAKRLRLAEHLFRQRDPDASTEA